MLTSRKAYWADYDNAWRVTTDDGLDVLPATPEESKVLTSVAKILGVNHGTPPVESL